MATSSIRRRVAVVGGGIVGCAIAYRLTRAGFGVILLERDAIAAHASGRNAGNVNPLHGTPRSLVPFALEAFRLHREIRRELVRLGYPNAEAFSVKRVHLGYEEGDRKLL